MGYSPCGLTELDMTGLHFTFRRPTGKMTEPSAPDPTLSDIYTHTHSTHTWTENNRRTQVHTPPSLIVRVEFFKKLFEKTRIILSESP